MPLELRTQRDGRLRPNWYGRYEINGQHFRPNLLIKIRGTPPASRSLRDEGDGAFERSRAAAQAKLDSLVEEVRTKRDSARLVEKLYEIKTGESIRSVKLAELPDEWLKIPRKRKPNDRYAAQCMSTLRRFSEFIQQENVTADEIAHVTRTLARLFMDAESNRRVTAKTWNDTLKLLRATFKYLLPAGAINPFADMPTRETDTVFRKPFSPEELKAILNTAQDDKFIRPILIIGMCTAMRRGDCCLLQWKDVDLKHRFVTVKTAKTEQTVSIPIFPMFYDELVTYAQNSEHVERCPNDYVFPEQAKMYLENPDGITWRVKKILAGALGHTQSSKKDEKALPEVSLDEARQRGRDYIAKIADSEKKERIATVFDLYMGGKKICEVVETAKVSKGSVSNYLNKIEKAVGCRIVRGRADGKGLTSRLRTDSALLGAEREVGIRRASVRDFHSFRVTWVTLALTSGVPLELVQKVTGHKTTDIVLKHYFQPGREAFRQALHAVMPKLLTNGQKSPKEEMLAIIKRVTPKTWKRDKAKLLELLKAA